MGNLTRPAPYQLGLDSLASDIIPSANVTYDLGNTTNSWGSLFLAGNTITLGGAEFKTDPTTGAVAIIPAITESNPSPSALVITANGIGTTTTSNGAVSNSGFSSPSQISGGGGGGSNTKTYRYQGRLGVSTGEIRKYFNASATMSSIDAYVSTAPTGANLTIVVKKNGTTAETFSITAGNTSNTGISATTSFEAGDYMTVDITQVGSSFAGQDLYVVFNF